MSPNTHVLRLVRFFLAESHASLRWVFGDCCDVEVDHGVWIVPVPLFLHPSPSSPSARFTEDSLRSFGTTIGCRSSSSSGGGAHPLFLRRRTAPISDPDLRGSVFRVALGTLLKSAMALLVGSSAISFVVVRRRCACAHCKHEAKTRPAVAAPFESKRSSDRPRTRPVLLHSQGRRGTILDGPWADAGFENRIRSDPRMEWNEKGRGKGPNGRVQRLYRPVCLWVSRILRIHHLDVRVCDATAGKDGAWDGRWPRWKDTKGSEGGIGTKSALALARPSTCLGKGVEKGMKNDTENEDGHVHSCFGVGFQAAANDQS